MARIAGVDIPREKRLEILTYIFGIGRTTSNQVCTATGVNRDTRVREPNGRGSGQAQGVDRRQPEG